MTTIMRRTVRGASAGLGALAIIAGTAACGGLLDGDEGQGGDDPAVEEPADDGAEENGAGDDGTENDGAEDDGAAGESDTDTDDTDSDGTDSVDTDSDGTEEGDEGAAAGGDDDAAGGSLSEDDLTAAGDRFMEFFEAIGEEDAEGACELLIDPDTGAPAEGSGLERCAAEFEKGLGEDFDPSLVSVIDRAMIDAVDNGDGTAGITLMDEPSDMTMALVDGEWYLVVEGDF
ncbi:hypothetical protein ACT3SP_02695 [Brachybacterium sp. AOP43-C2-M15]|uniref:hypothetical protein n=1 Tax=Brachybacterium sp. AOP43-C2-M15 TaxID=3457661 RepID=UPI004034E2B7